MWIMQKKGENQGVQFVSVRRIGGMCFSSNEKTKGGDKNRGGCRKNRGENLKSGEQMP